MATILKTPREVIEALGGVRRVANMTGRKYSAAYNWLKFKTLPPDTYIALKTAVESLGYQAPDSLWRMVPPKTRKRAA